MLYPRFENHIKNTISVRSVGLSQWAVRGAGVHWVMVKVRIP